MFPLFSPIWWIFGGGLVAILFRDNLKLYMRSVWLVIRLPGPPALPFIGHAHWVANSKRLVDAALELPKNHGPIIGAWVSIFPIVVIFEPRYIQKILSNTKHVEKLPLYKMMHNFLGEGLVTIDGQRWKTHRRLLQPSFRLTILEGFLDIFTRGADFLVNNLKQHVQSEKRSVNIGRFINEMVFTILMEAILGVPMDSPQARELRNDSPYRRGSTSLIQRLLRPWLMCSKVYQVTELARREMDQKDALIRFTKKAMAERRKILEQDPTTRSCFLDFLLETCDENPDSFTDNDCAQEACTLMLAGQDSVGAALAFAIHLLANHPDEQTKAMMELESIFDKSRRSPKLDDIQRMSYLECCLKEALRLFPSVPIIGRTLGEDLQLDKWTIPKGCDILISPYATHRLDEYYPNAELYDPERFQPINVAKRPSYSYLPFSAGPRNCIGYKYAELEMKAVLSAVLRAFHLSPVEGKENVSLSYRVTLRAAGGLWVSLRPRDADGQRSQ